VDIVFANASAKFANRNVLEPLSIRLTEHRIGIIGLNGSGKSTFARMINGLVFPHAGSVVTNGFETRQDAERVRSIVGYIFQNPANQIVLPVVRDDIALGMKRLRLGTREVEQRVSDVLARLGIGHLAERRAHELSGGEVQLVALAAVLATSPDIVIMDEPTNQLDLRNRNMVTRTIRDLVEDVIVVTHDLALLANFDRVLLFHEGRILADGPAENVIARYEELVQ